MANFAPVPAAGAFHVNNRFNFFEGTLLAALQRHAAPAAIITPPIGQRTLAYGRPRSAILTATGAAFGWLGEANAQPDRRAPLSNTWNRCLANRRPFIEWSLLREDGVVLSLIPEEFAS